MRLDCAEISTGAGDVLERTGSVPAAGGKSIVRTARERPVVARAGVSGSAWATVWLPSLLDGREQAQLRVAPISHAGELLGLGEAPGDNADRRLLGFSIIAAALAAIGYLPVRGRLIAFATRFVYGTREAPGESLRTFGSRMTRAVSMDELLLQLAE